MRDIFEALAEVLEAGAKRSRGWSMNTERQQQAEVLEAMAKKAREISEKDLDIPPWDM